MMSSEAIIGLEESGLSQQLDTSSVNRALTLRRIFGIALILSTAIFFAGAFREINFFIPIQTTINKLATIHVPMTMYLLFDRDIRASIWNRPLQLIGVPIPIFIL
jgi:hypothetical protein